VVSVVTSDPIVFTNIRTKIGLGWSFVVATIRGKGVQINAAAATGAVLWGVQSSPQHCSTLTIGTKTIEALKVVSSYKFIVVL